MLKIYVFIYWKTTTKISAKSNSFSRSSLRLCLCRGFSLALGWGRSGLALRFCLKYFQSVSEISHVSHHLPRPHPHPPSSPHPHPQASSGIINRFSNLFLILWEIKYQNNLTIHPPPLPRPPSCPRLQARPSQPRTVTKSKSLTTLKSSHNN